MKLKTKKQTVHKSTKDLYWKLKNLYWFMFFRILFWKTNSKRYRI